jgi:membrane protein
MLTFWLRPAFVLRVINRFQRIQGFDRAMSLASNALTAMIPLIIASSALLAHVRHAEAADRIIRRYKLTGGGAEAVSAVFSAPENAGVGLLGLGFLLISMLSFTRSVQRLFEQAWDLKPLSVRNTPNGLLWIAVLAGYLAAATWIRAATGRPPFDVSASCLTAPLTAVLLIASGWLLSGRRLDWKDLLPFAVAAAIVQAGYSVAGAAYLPHYFSSSATRFGPMGAVFAMITTLFVVMLLITVCGAFGREVGQELDRIRRGERPPYDEVRREWDAVFDQVRMRWRGTRHFTKGKKDEPED